MKILTIVVFGVVLFGVTEALHRFRKLAWVLLLLLPVVLTPLWIKTSHNPFIWAKLYSIIALSIALIAYCLPRVMQLQRFYWIVITIIFFNMFEAIAQNAYSGIHLHSWQHLLNAVAGVLLVAALPFKNFMRVEKSEQRTVVYCTSFVGWAICYSIWDWLFVYLEWPEYIGIQTMLLAVPLLFMLVNKDLWVETRAFSLALYLIVHFTNTPFVDSLNLSYTPSILFAKICAIVSFVSCAALLLTKWRRHSNPNLMRT